VKTDVYLLYHLAEFLEWEIFCRENQNKYLMFSILFPRKSCRLWDNVEKYGTAGQATDDNTAHARFVLDN